MEHVIEYDESQWEASGSEEDPTSRLRLKGGVTVAGLLVHVEAVAVRDVTLRNAPDEYVTVAADELFDDTIDRICDEIDGSPRSVDLVFGGRPRTYTIVGLPSAF